MYYLVIVQNGNTQAVYAYNSLDNALAAFHSELAYRSADRTSTKCTILNSDLVQVRVEQYVAGGTEEPQEG